MSSERFSFTAVGVTRSEAKAQGSGTVSPHELTSFWYQTLLMTDTEQPAVAETAVHVCVFDYLFCIIVSLWLGRSFLPRGCLTLCVWGLSLWLCDCLVSGVHNSPCDIWIRWASACYVTFLVSLSCVIFEHFHCASYFYLLPACFSLCLFCVWNILCSLLRHRAELKKTLLDKSLCRLKCAEMMLESGLAQIIVGKPCAYLCRRASCVTTDD